MFKIKVIGRNKGVTRTYWISSDFYFKFNEEDATPFEKEELHHYLFWILSGQNLIEVEEITFVLH